MSSQRWRPTRRLVILVSSFATIVCLAVLGLTAVPLRESIYPVLPAPIPQWKLQSNRYPGYTLRKRASSEAAFHYLVPATSSNVHLCRLLASAAATGFPAPALLMWGNEEDADEYKTHMAKVDAISAYLNFQPQHRDDDLVMIVDGFDVWHQLPPDVLISRYHAAVAAADHKLRDAMGPLRMSMLGVKNTVFFGPDKICWPEDPSRAACWAVPESPLPRWAFGPETDSGAWRNTNRPRWLNSGTIIGPMRDVREVFEAVRKTIEINRSVDSDQFYFSNIWGRQEYNRRVHAGEDIDSTVTVAVTNDWKGSSSLQYVVRETPDDDSSERSEYHMAVDHTSSMFQTAAYYADFLKWTLHSSAPALHDSHSEGFVESRVLPSDIANSAPPLSRVLPQSAEERNLAWTNISLGTNTASGEIFGLIHFTPPKSLRDKWWSRMWYFPFLESVVKDAMQPEKDSPIYTDGNGVTWTAHSPLDGESEPGTHALAPVEGKWSRVSWSDACGIHEAGVFGSGL